MVQRCRVLRIISFASLALAYVFLHVHLALAVQKVKVKVDSTFLDCGLWECLCTTGYNYNTTVLQILGTRTCGCGSTRIPAPIPSPHLSSYLVVNSNSRCSQHMVQQHHFQWWVCCTIYSRLSSLCCVNKRSKAGIYPASKVTWFCDLMSLPSLAPARAPLSSNTLHTSQSCNLSFRKSFCDFLQVREGILLW